MRFGDEVYSDRDWINAYHFMMKKLYTVYQRELRPYVGGTILGHHIFYRNETGRRACLILDESVYIEGALPVRLFLNNLKNVIAFLGKKYSIFEVYYHKDASPEGTPDSEDSMTSTGERSQPSSLTPRDPSEIPLVWLSPQDATNSKWATVYYKGGRYSYHHWKEAYCFLMSELFKDFKDKLSSTIDKDYSPVPFFFSIPTRVRVPSKVAENVWMETNLSVESIVENLRDVLNFVGLPLSKILITYKKWIHDRKSLASIPGNVTVRDVNNEAKASLPITREPAEITVNWLSPQDVTWGKMVNVYYNGEKRFFEDWKRAYQYILSELFVRFNARLSYIVDKPRSPAPFFLSQWENLRSPLGVADNVWIETNLCANDIVKNLKMVVDFVGLPLSAIEITYQIDKEEKEKAPRPSSLLKYAGEADNLFDMEYESPSAEESSILTLDWNRPDSVAHSVPVDVRHGDRVEKCDTWEDVYKFVVMEIWRDVCAMQKALGFSISSEPTLEITQKTETELVREMKEKIVKAKASLDSFGVRYRPRSVEPKKELPKILDWSKAKSIRFTQPIRVMFHGDTYEPKSWKQVYMYVLKKLYKLYPEEIRDLLDKPLGNGVCLTSRKEDCKDPEIVADGIWAETTYKHSKPYIFIRLAKNIMDGLKFDSRAFYVDYKMKDCFKYKENRQES